MILHPSFVLPVMPGETPVGYASRVALSMGCTLRVLCTRMNLPHQKLLDGVPSAIAALRQACQLADDVFVDTTYVRLAGRRYEIAGEILSMDQLNREALRICPVCVDEQFAGGRKVHEVSAPREWRIVPLYVCDVHSTPLVDVEVTRHHRQDFAGLLEQAKRRGMLALGQHETVLESGLGLHIRHRLSGLSDEHMLSSMPLYVAIKAAEMIGTVAAHGAHHSWFSLTSSERFEAGRIGYGILGEGEIGLRGLFADLQRQSHSEETSTAGLVSTFGKLYLSLSKSEDLALAPLRDIMRRHVIETMPFDRGDIVLGEKVAERRTHSARTVAADLGVSVKTALRRLRLVGVLDEENTSMAWKRTTFDAREHAGTVRRLAGALQRAEAGRYLGLKVVTEDVAPILEMVGSMNTDKSRPLEQLFAKDDLDAFLAAVLSKASSVPAGEGFEPILMVSKRTRAGITSILEMVMKGVITDVRLSSAHKGILSLMVRKADVLAVTTAHRSWMTLTSASKAYRMRDTTLSALVRSGIIPSKGTSPLMLQEKDLDEFRRTYVTRRELTMKYRRLRSRANRYSVTKAFADAGLTPAFDEKQSRLVFFDREAVLTALGPP